MPIWLYLFLGGGVLYAVTRGVSVTSQGVSESDVSRAVSIALAKETKPANLTEFAARLLPFNAGLSAKLSARAAELTPKPAPKSATAQVTQNFSAYKLTGH